MKGLKTICGKALKINLMYETKLFFLIDKTYA